MEDITFENGLVPHANYSFKITVPKYLIRAGLVDPKATYEITLKKKK